MTTVRRYWLPILLAVVGTAVLGVAWLQQRPSAPADPGALVAAPTVAPTTTPTITPEPIVPTRTPEGNPTGTPRPAATERPTSTVTAVVPTGTSTDAAPTAVAPTSTVAAPTRTVVAPTSTAVAPTSTVATTNPPPAHTPTTPAATASPAPATATSEPDPTSAPAAAAPTFNLSYGSRFGATGGLGQAGAALQAGLPFGSFLNWNVALEPPFTGIEFWQMLRVGSGGIRNVTWDELETAVANNPGSIWIVGNEPDVAWQDGVTPETYAVVYHDAYTFIKERDPSAKIAIGGVSQSTPLRRAYLDRILTHYQNSYGAPMPIDIWNVHAFTLREEAGSWGVGIPPGMSETSGMLYEIEDHNNLDIWKQNLIDFRMWMAARGYGDKPLVVSEYGILLPADYGFPPEVVAAFMRETVGFMQSAADETGYGPDGGRLVQWWFWYILHDPDLYPTGNLFDPATGQLTQVGEEYRRLITGQ